MNQGSLHAIYNRANSRNFAGKTESQNNHLALAETGASHERDERRIIRYGLSRRSLSGQGREPIDRVLHQAAWLQAGSQAAAGFRKRVIGRSYDPAQWSGGVGVAPDAGRPSPGAGRLEPGGAGGGGPFGPN